MCECGRLECEVWWCGGPELLCSAAAPGRAALPQGKDCRAAQHITHHTAGGVMHPVLQTAGGGRHCRRAAELRCGAQYAVLSRQPGLSAPEECRKSSGWLRPYHTGCAAVPLLGTRPPLPACRKARPPHTSHTDTTTHVGVQY